ncbi:putative transcription factor MYB-HB-like family [Helianthus annuus]|nr:putative transcription factor MYB-HB-like family [Helianthus annuus]KAJ0591600.1 putative transcription factor MYB-HB-like family [Helianthus annuus]KAJ0766592.1 putative transcription factor MYB-HB-like family [Helianthus annuus]KAJ0772487.1 putative transcription factor MYB-HB-like family [Helianthus annuus]KAJ0941918.1 putative transcription factor MYB-HB-like family [Helianthus annuus]
MLTSASELSLECKPHSYSNILLKTMGDQQVSTNGNDQTEKLEEFLSRLEEERLKIDAFKRELPLCMQLLTNAMESSRQQLQTYRANQSSPVLEEFIPMKNSNGSGPEKASNSSIDNKANWMTSAQLWSQAGNTVGTTITTNTATNDHLKTTQNNATFTTPNETDINFNTKQRNGGAFLPFSKERNSSCSTPAVVLPELALSSGEKDVDHEENKSCVRENSSIKGGSGEVNDQTTMNTTTTTSGTATSSQTHRKTRRCWSPDLHRRFVNALQMLGGSQVATPKQIRELMKVDGLTNDEVKSHLQKYRLHTRRPSPTPQAAGTATPQLVVLGGIWVPPEYAATAAGAQTLYTTHTNPHYATHQEFYSSSVMPPPHHHPTAAGNHHQLHHHNIHMYKPSSQTTQSLQESGSRGGGTATAGGNRSESIEDGKSESGGSWKAESGGDTKALMLREECEESNGSEITLKF